MDSLCDVARGKISMLLAPRTLNVRKFGTGLARSHRVQVALGESLECKNEPLRGVGTRVVTTRRRPVYGIRQHPRIVVHAGMRMIAIFWRALD